MKLFLCQWYVIQKHLIYVICSNSLRDRWNLNLPHSKSRWYWVWSGCLIRACENRTKWGKNITVGDSRIGILGSLASQKC